jgi:hypothetical protein
MSNGTQEIEANIDLKRIRHIFDSNQMLIQKADGKVGIFLAINAIVISVTAGWNLKAYDALSKNITILAVSLSGISVITLLYSIFPSTTKTQSITYYNGILNFEDAVKYFHTMLKMSDREIFWWYSKDIYSLARIQKKRYIFMQIGLIFLGGAIILLAFSFGLQNI